MSKLKPHPSKEFLIKNFTYLDGSLYFVKSGKIVGTISTTGYLRVKIDKKDYAVHRLIWIYHYGDTNLDIDHIDRNKTNNKIENLRAVTRSQNLHNATAKRGNRGGCIGVNYNKNGCRWQASIRVNYKQYYLGSSLDYFEACCLRKSGENRLSPLK